MVEVLLVLSVIGAIILIGFIGNLLFKKTMVPNTLWLIFFGIFLSFFNFVGSDFIIGIAGIIGAIAVIGILSDGGMNLNLRTVLTDGYIGWLLLITGIVFSLISSVIVLIFFGFSIEIGVLVGLIIAGTSSAIIIPLMISLKVSDKVKTILSIESVADTFSIMLALIMMSFLSGEITLTQNNIIQIILSEFFSAIAIGALFGLIWSTIVFRLKKIEFSYSATLGVFILLYVFAELIGANGAITIFFAGLLISNSHFILSSLFPEKSPSFMDNDLNKTHSLIVFFIRTFFFVFLGMFVGLPDIKFLIIGFLIVLLIFLFRVGYIQLFSKTGLIKFSKQEKQLAFISIPRGLSAAILTAFILSFNIPQADEIVQIIFSIIIFSIIFTTIGVFIIFRPKANNQTINNTKKEDSLERIDLSSTNFIKNI
jgi:potassium/hydrogen antiporter